jgi:hypothetical protein
MTAFSTPFDQSSKESHAKCAKEIHTKSNQSAEGAGEEMNMKKKKQQRWRQKRQERQPARHHHHQQPSTLGRKLQVLGKRESVGDTRVV